MKTKICKCCNKEKPIKEFGKVKVNGKIYYRHKCKICIYEGRKDGHKKYQKKNRKKINQQQQLWRKNNPEKVKSLAKKHYNKLKQNPNHKELWKQKSQKWRDKNKLKYKKYIREYCRKWIKENPNYYKQPFTTLLKPGEKNYYSQLLKKNKKYILGVLNS